MQIAKPHKFALMAIALGFAVIASEPTVAMADDEDDEKKVDFGLGAGARQLRLTRGLSELFTETAPGGTRTEGYSIEFARRGKEVEFVFGFGYDNLEASDGYYLESGGDPLVAGQVDLTEFTGFHVYTIDATLVTYLELHKVLAVRVGAGLGVAVVRGEIVRTDAICSSDNLQRDCAPDPAGPQQRDPIDIPPAIPVLELLVGMQFRPMNALAINLDLGLRNVPYVGASAMLYLW